MNKQTINPSNLPVKHNTNEFVRSTTENNEAYNTYTVKLGEITLRLASDNTLRRAQLDISRLTFTTPINTTVADYTGNFYITNELDTGKLCWWARGHFDWVSFDYALPKSFCDDYYKANNHQPRGVWVYTDDDRAFGHFVSSCEIFDALYKAIYTALANNDFTVNKLTPKQ